MRWPAKAWLDCEVCLRGSAGLRVPSSHRPHHLRSPKAPEIQIDADLIAQHARELQEAQNVAIGDDDEDL